MGDSLGQSYPDTKMDQIENLKVLCRKIVRNDIDHFELTVACEKFKLDFQPSDDFSYKKKRLKQAVLSEILKGQNLSIDDKRMYGEMMEATGKSLEFRSSAVKGFPCSLVGCLFRGERHRDYVQHLEKIHSTSTPFQCKVGHECIRNFDSISDLKSHVKLDHQRRNVGQNKPLESASGVQLQDQVKCNMLSCGGEIFSKTTELTSHMNIRHKLEFRDCVFKDCDTKFNPNAASRNHFRQKHYTQNKVALKPVHLLVEVSEENEQGGGDIAEVDDGIWDDASSDCEDGNVEDGNDEDENIESCQEESKDDDYFLMAYADFINRLITYKFIPVTSVKAIATEFLNQSQRSCEGREAALRKSLSKIPSLTTAQIEQIVLENAEDPFLKAQEELSSEFKRNKFMEENFKFVKPLEIVLNKDEVKNGAHKDCIHYVPIIEALKALVEDESFNKMILMAEEEDVHEDTLKDVRDGTAYKKNLYFRHNPDALAIMMYSDGVELTNPLSSGKGKHKIVQLFWTLCEIPRHQRSAVDKIQLGLVFKEKLLKKYTHGQIFKSLLADLKTLETVGVQVREPFERRVKAALFLYSGDNLECHTIGGFSSCFSSRDICR